MKSEHEKQTVITLNDESFKHYLIERYGHDAQTWNKSKNAAQELIPSETWIQLYHHAKDDVTKRGGTLIGYELVNNVLLSHDGINAHWPMNWMWVIRFGKD